MDICIGWNKLDVSAIYHVYAITTKDVSFFCLSGLVRFSYSFIGWISNIQYYELAANHGDKRAICAI